MSPSSMSVYLYNTQYALNAQQCQEKRLSIIDSVNKQNINATYCTLFLLKLHQFFDQLFSSLSQ